MKSLMGVIAVPIRFEAPALELILLEYFFDYFHFAGEVLTVMHSDSQDFGVPLFAKHALSRREGRRGDFSESLVPLNTGRNPLVSAFFKGGC
jgi:hypothetical protein